MKKIHEQYTTPAQIPMLPIVQFSFLVVQEGMLKGSAMGLTEPTCRIYDREHM